MNAFVAAGYDLPFIQKHRLSEADLDCVGVPTSKLGLRKKLMALHQLEKFAAVEEGSEGEADSNDDDSGSDSDDES